MKDFNWPEFWMAFIFAITGGSVHVLGKLAAGSYKSRWGVVLDLMTAFFAGALAYSACKYFRLELWATGGICGLAGHAGTRAIVWGERYLTKRLGVDDQQEPKP